nr:MAG TPA: hypothetical protein [Caudoviricetes sp.]
MAFHFLRQMWLDVAIYQEILLQFAEFVVWLWILFVLCFLVNILHYQSQSAF